MNEQVQSVASDPLFNPLAPDFIRNPYPHYDRLRTIDPIHVTPFGQFVASRHAEVSLVMRDKRFGKDFVELAHEQQDLILDNLARGRIPVRGVPQEALFRGLHSLTLEGFLCDPVHGGNDAEIGWRSIGFPTPHLRHVH